MKEILKNLHTASSEVFFRPSYVALASAFALLGLLFAVLLPNIGLITNIFTASSALLALKLKLVVSLLGGIRTNFSILSAGYTVMIATLFGVNIAMMAYVLKHQRTPFTKQERTVGFGGMVSGVLGIGCAFCGSFLLSATLSFFGAAGAIALLPLRGGEFGIASVVLLLISLALISKKISVSLTCNTKPL